MSKPDLTIAPSQSDEGKYIKEWLNDPVIIRWFPLHDEREIDDTIRIWESFQKMGASLSAYIEGKVVGITQLYLQAFEKLAHQCLFWILVHPDFRGKGIGGKLLDELEILAKEKFGIKILHLEVYESNPAIHLYERKGFVRYGLHKHFIKEPTEYIDKIMMEKRL